MSLFNFLDGGSESIKMLGFAQVSILSDYLLEKLFVGCLSFFCVCCQRQFSHHALIDNIWLETRSEDIDQFGKSAGGIFAALRPETFISFEIHRVNPLHSLQNIIQRVLLIARYFCS